MCDVIGEHCEGTPHTARYDGRTLMQCANDVTCTQPRTNGTRCAPQTIYTLRETHKHNERNHQTIFCNKRNFIFQISLPI